MRTKYKVEEEVLMDVEMNPGMTNRDPLQPTQFSSMMPPVNNMVNTLKETVTSTHF